MSEGRFEQAALSYAQNHCWAVYPVYAADGNGCTCGTKCSSPGKHPRIKGGFKAATKKPDQIQQWADKWPNANIGVATGRWSGIFVLDIDLKHGGDRSLKELEEKYGPLPATVESITGSGGGHKVFGYVEGIKSSTGKLAPGIDVRGEGGSAILPPSMHASGRNYGWKQGRSPDEIAIADAPEWLLQKLMPTSGQTAKPIPARKGVILEGQRNPTLASFAGSMRRRGMTEVAIEAALIAENGARCDPPLPDSEVRGIAASIAKYDPTDSAVVESAEDDCIEEWPEPLPLPDKLPSVEPFDFEMLPEKLKPWIKDIAERMQCPPEFPATTAMVALGAVVGRQVAICPQQQDDWMVVPNLFGLNVGRPSLLKTPAMREALKPIIALEAEAKAEYEAEMKIHRANRFIDEEKKKISKESVRQKLKDEEKRKNQNG